MELKVQKSTNQKYFRQGLMTQQNSHKNGEANRRRRRKNYATNETKRALNNIAMHCFGIAIATVITTNKHQESRNRSIRNLRQIYKFTEKGGGHEDGNKGTMNTDHIELQRTAAALWYIIAMASRVQCQISAYTKKANSNHIGWPLLSSQRHPSPHLLSLLLLVLLHHIELPPPPSSK